LTIVGANQQKDTERKVMETMKSAATKVAGSVWQVSQQGFFLPTPPRMNGPDILFISQSFGRSPLTPHGRREARVRIT